jgi:AraC-like DNA-binding protein
VNAASNQDQALSDVLDGTGLTPALLDDPACLADMQQCRKVISNLIRLTGDQGIGLKMGQEVEIGDFGIIAHAMLSSQTLRQAIEYWVQYSNLVGMLIRLTQQEQEGAWVIVFTETEPLGFVYNFAVEEILITGIKLGGLLSGAALQVREITVTYPAPMHVKAYGEYFPCPVRFNAERTSIIVDSPSLDTPLPTKNDELNEVFRRHCMQLMRQIGQRDPIAARVRGVLIGSGRQLPNLTEAAKRLGISSRSLRRHLASEGASYQKVLDNFRLDMAREYLRSEHFAIKQVADLLGFRDANSFRRAFKNWSGQTIQQFRRSEP